MPRDNNGNTSPLPGTIVANGDTILPSQHNPMVQDVYAMISQSLSRDGQGGMRAPLSMNGFAIQGLPTALQDTDAVSLGQSRENGVPIGAIIDFAGTVAPEKWIFCFGQAVSRLDYPELFSAIGIAYGSGNGTTTFNLPDYRGRVSAGKDDMGGQNANRLGIYYGSISQSLGGSLGLAYHTLNSAENGPHNHTGTTSSDGAHTHTIPSTATSISSGGIGTGLNATSTISTSSSGVHSHTFTTSTSGQGEPHPNAQPTIIMNKIIKATY